MLLDFLKKPSSISTMLANTLAIAGAILSGGFIVLAATYWFHAIISVFFYWLKIPYVSRKSPGIRNRLKSAFILVVFLLVFASIFFFYIAGSHLFQGILFGSLNLGTALLGVPTIIFGALFFLAACSFNFYIDYANGNPKDISEYKVTEKEISIYKNTLIASNKIAELNHSTKIVIEENPENTIRIGKFNSSELAGLITLLIFTNIGVFAIGQEGLLLILFGIAKTVGDLNAQYQAYVM